jgi:hypothetical protein
MSANTVYSTRVSAAVAAEQAAKATEEGMRELAAAMAARAATAVENHDSNEDINTDSDSESDSGSSYRRGRKSRAKTRTTTRGVDTGKLEDRIRYLQLDLSNALVDVAEAKAGKDELSAQLAPYKRVNDELTYFKSALARAFKDVGSFTKAQLEARFKIFQEEATEHANLCSVSIEKIGLDEVKAGMFRVLNAERKRFTQIEKNYKFLILQTGAKEMLLLICYWMSVLVILFAVGYKMIF